MPLGPAALEVFQVSRDLPVSRDASLFDLNQVIRRIEAKSRDRAPVVRRAVSLEATLGGTVEETGAGRVLVVRRRYDLDHRHGRQPLSRAHEIDAVP